MTEESDTVTESSAVPVEQASDVDKTETRSEAGNEDGEPGTPKEGDEGEVAGQEEKEGDVLSDDAAALKSELDKIKVEAPTAK